MKKVLPVLLFISIVFAQTTVVGVAIHADFDNNGTYNTGDVIGIVVEFSAVVTVGGDEDDPPTLTLETGEGSPFPADAVVDYSSGSATRFLRFNYTVATGHHSDDLDYVNVSSLQLNGGTIDATLTLPEPGAAGSLGNNAAVIIRTISVTVTMINDPVRTGYMNEDNRMDITVTLHGSAAKPLSDFATFSTTQSYARGLWASSGEIPPITATGQSLTHSEGGSKLLDNSLFVNGATRKVEWTGTTGDNHYNGVTGNEIEFGLSLSGEQRVNIDIKVQVQDFENNYDYYINVNDWGSAGESSYLSYDGYVPELHLQYYDYNSWEGRNDWAFNFETKQIKIRFYEGNWDATTEILSVAGLFPEISFEVHTGTDDNDHTYIVGTLDNEELTTTSYKEIDLTDESLDFGDPAGLVDGVHYNITYNIYDLAGNNRSGNKYTNLKYDVTSPEVGLTYSRDPTSVLDVSGTFTITADFIEGIYGTPKIAINQPGASDLGATNMVKDENVNPENSVWTYDYPVVSHEQFGYEDGTAIVTISNAKDLAGNSNAAAQNATFIIDTTPPTISNCVIDDDNTQITVTFTDGGGVFSTDVYSDASETTLEDITAAFVLSITGGTATFADGAVEGYNPDDVDRADDLIYVLDITLDGIADGSEVITITPFVEDGEPSTYHIFDNVGNGAVANQNNNTVTLNDKTDPIFVNNADPVETGVVLLEIVTNEWPAASGNKYFNDTSPTLTLKASDAGSPTLKLSCKVSGGFVDITDSEGNSVDINNQLDITSLEEERITITLPDPGLAVAYTEFQDNQNAGDGNHRYIKFILEDASGNTTDPAVLHPTVRLDTRAAGYSPIDPNIAPDNSYAVVAFDEDVFSDEFLNPVTDLDYQFDQNGGTATANILNGVAGDNIDGSIITTGVTAIRVFLNLVGNADGLEKIRISPGVKDRAGNTTTDASDWIILADETAPVVTIVSGFTGNTFPDPGGVLYVKEFESNNVVLKAMDARSDEDVYSMQASFEANGVPITPINGDANIVHDENTDFELGDDDMADGAYNGNFVFSVTDQAGNIGTKIAADFTYDTRGPEISEVTVDADNGYIKVKFESHLFSAIDADGLLEVTDFVLSIAGGVAKFDGGVTENYNPNSISDHDGETPLVEGESWFRLGLALNDDLPNGNEIITVLPVADAIYDAAGNVGTQETQTNNNINHINLVDKTNPSLEIVTDIAGNTTVDGDKYVNDATPVVTLRAVDSFSTGPGALSLTCTVNNVDFTINPTTLTSGGNTDVTIIGSPPLLTLTDGTAYNGTVEFTVSDEAGNSVSIPLDNFTIDTSPPKIISYETDPSDYPDTDDPDQKIIITFDTPVYSTADGSRNPLEASHFESSVSSTNPPGVARVRDRPIAIEHPFDGVDDGDPSKVGMTIRLTADSPNPDGSEEVTISFAGDEDVYDFAGNRAENPLIEPIPPAVKLFDETAPILVNDNGDPNTIFSDIEVNFVNDVNYFSDQRPSLRLRADDAGSPTVTIICQVGGITGSVALISSVIASNTDIEININQDLPAGGYSSGNDPHPDYPYKIEFQAIDAPTDIDGNCLACVDANNNATEHPTREACLAADNIWEGCNRSPFVASFNNVEAVDGFRYAKLEPDAIEILDDQCIMAADNSYIDVVFSGGVYGDDEALTGLTAADFNITVNQNVDVGGLVTDCNIVSAKKDDSNIEGNATNLTGGETTVRVFLDFGGIDASGVETIEIGPSNNTSIYSRSTVATPSSETVTIHLNDKVAPTITITDIVGNLVNYGLEDTTYSNDPTPTFGITATDAKSTGDGALTLTCQVDEDNKNIDITALTNGNLESITITDELDDILYNGTMITFSVEDASGNVGTGSPSFFVLDTVRPFNPVIDTIITTSTDNSVPGFWNSDNTALAVTVRFPPQLTVPTSDSTLLGGRIQLKAARVDENPVYSDLGVPVDIPLDDEWTVGDPINDVIVNVDAAVFEALDGFDDPNTSYDISVVVYDRALNTNFPDKNADGDPIDFNDWYNEKDNGIYINRYINYEQLPIVIDQISPVDSTIGAHTFNVPLTVYSEEREYYWNISTESMEVKIFFPDHIDTTVDPPDTTDELTLIGGGTVQLFASIGGLPPENLGSLTSIVSNDSVTIEILDEMEDPVNGVEDLDNFLDGAEMVITAMVRDRAGNGTIYTRNTTDGPHGGAVKIDQTPATITTITSTSADGWYMVDDEVNIRLEANEPIEVSEDTQLLLSSEGLATYDVEEQGIDASIHDFSYVVADGETSEPDTNANGTIDGLLEMTSIEPVVLKDGEKWVEGIKDFAGNYTPNHYNGTVHIPLANTPNALDYQKELHIDGEAPTAFSAKDNISYKAIDNIHPIARPMIDPDDPILNGTLWKYIGGVYWNTTHTDLDVTVVLDENDQSLASGSNRGAIQLKVSSDPDLNTPVDQYLNLSIEEDILPASVAAGSQTITLTSSDVEGIAGFADGAKIRITALIKDIAGNESSYFTVPDMEMITVDLTLPDTAGISLGIIIDPTVDPPQEKVPDYWNMHTKNISIAIPLPDPVADTTMENGRIDLLGKINTSTIWDTLGRIGLKDVYYLQHLQPLDTLNLILDSVRVPFNAGVEDDTIGVEEITGFTDGNVLEIKAVLYDRAGNPINYDLGPNATLLIDETASVITMTTPVNGSHGNTATVAYALTEDIASGIITWNPEPGALDTVHSKILVGDELNQGSFTGLITNSPELVDSTIYDIIFTATEVPGNTIINDTILSFTFDTLAPNFSMLGPDSLAFINNSRVSYKISEDLASGQIKWKRISGITEEENTVYIIDLVEPELEGIYHTNILPANDNEDFLIDGEIYNVTWTGIDKAGNPTRLEFISTEVVYDTTHPTAELIYNNYIVGEDYPLTITVNLSETIRDYPLISIDYQGLGNDVEQDTLLKDPDFDDGTVWYFNTLVPPGHNNSGIAFVTIDAQDRASNPLLVYYNRDTLEVDNFLPSCQLQYINISKNWLINEGGGGNEIEIRGDFNKPITETLPVINIAYGDSTDASFAGLLPSDSAAAGSTFTWYVTLPGDSINSGSMLVDLLAYDRALSDISSDSTFNDTIFIIDNIPPALGITDTIVPYGYNAQPGWINAYTDSIGIEAQMPEDPSLPFNRRGGIDVQIKNKNRPPSLWVPISNIGSPYGDSLTVYGTQFFWRSMDEITNISDTSNGFEPGVSLVHGDTLMFRLLVSDRVGNTTIYETSNTMLVYDPIQPKIIVLNSGNMFTENALVSTDQITAGWSGSVDSTFQGFIGSGIQEYKYKIMEYDTIPPNDTLTIVDWTSTGITVSLDTTLDLTPLNLYQVFITAVDTAGNELSTMDTTFDDDGNVLSVEVIPSPVGSNVLPRHNTAPLIESFTANTAWEDSLYTAQVMVTDMDVTTTKSDSFTYHIDWDTATTIGLEGPVLPIPDVDYPLGATVAIDINTGAITWTPLPPDTGIFDVEIIVMDAWNFADTLVYPLTIFPVNDRPYFRSGEAWDTTYNLPDLPLPDTAMFEDSEEIFRLNLTQYILDEDNDDSTDITWQAIIEDTITHPGYPRVSLVFGPGTTELVKDQLRSKYLQGQQYKKLQGSDLQRELPDRVERSLAPLINLELVQNDSSHITFAEIQADTNYWANNIKMTFIASDIEETFTLDSLLFDIVPINDRPRWIEIPEQDIIENDTLKFDAGAYVYDEDDTLLTFNTSILTSWTMDSSGSWTYDNLGGGLTILPPEYTSTNLGDTLMILPDQVWSGYAFIEIIATDEQGARDTVVFRLNVKHVPRPHLAINVVQNNAFTHFFDVIITDTLEMARSVILSIQNNRIELDTLDKFTYLGHTQFQDPGEYRIDVRAAGIVGDTLVRRFIGLALARTLGRWGGFSPDGLFKVAAEAGAVNMDQFILLVDSTMFKKGYSGSYKLGDEVRVFNKPVEVSMASYDEGLALYRRNTDNTWVELPSYNEQGRIRAFTDKMGYFRLGRKTLIVPGLTSLGQNYPNPFNPVTNITYDVGFVDGPDQQVNLSIYNLLGQQVITLVNDQLSIGRHNVKWYGKDRSGISVASGMYFVHMVTSTGKVQTKKVMLLR